MKILVLIVLVSVYVENATCCLKGWDVALAMRESTLNKAYLSIITNNFHLTFPTYTHKEKPNIPAGQPWGTQNSISLSGISINNLAIRAMKGQNQVGKLEVRFRAGTCTVSKKIVKTDGSSSGLPPSKKVYPFSTQIISFRVRVTSYKLAIGATKTTDRYKIKLIIVDDDAIIGNLMWKDLSVFDTGDVRKAITTLVQKTLAEGSKYDLGEFDLPKADNQKTSLVKDLFPKQIRFVFIYAPNGRSVFAALTSTTDSTPQPNAFHWTKAKLLRDDYDSSISINSDKFMNVLKQVITDKLNINSNNLQLSKSCPGTLSLVKGVDNFRGGVDLVSVSVTPYYEVDGKRFINNQIEVKLQLWKNVSPGVNVDIHATLRFKLTYNKIKKKFDVTKSYENSKTSYNKEWWVVVLEVLTLGIGRIVTAVIETIADSIIDQNLTAAFNFDPAAGGLPINIGGPLKVIFDNLVVGEVLFNSRGNLVFNFGILINGLG